MAEEIMSQNFIHDFIDEDLENGVYNIFEATVGGWGYNENQVP